MIKGNPIIHLTMSTKPFKYGVQSYWDCEQPRYENKVIKLNNFIEKIKEGYIWGNSYTNPDKSNKNTFISSQCIVYNIKSIFNLDEYVHWMEKNGRPLPTLAYPIENKKGKKLKLVYVFDKPLLKGDYEKMHNNVAKEIKMDPKLNPGNAVGNAMVNRHTGCTECGMFVSQNVYTMNDFS